MWREAVQFGSNTHNFHKLPIKNYNLFFHYYKLINYIIIIVCVQYIKMSTYLLKLVYYKILTIITDGIKVTDIMGLKTHCPSHSTPLVFVP